MGGLHLQSKSSRRETGVSDSILKIRPISVNSHGSPGIFQIFQRLHGIFLQLQDAPAREGIQVCLHIVASTFASCSSRCGVAAAARDDDLCVSQCLPSDCNLICNSITVKHLMLISSQLECVAGGVDFGLDVVLRTEAGERVSQYWIKTVLLPECRTIPYKCLLDWLRLFF